MEPPFMIAPESLELRRALLDYLSGAWDFDRFETWFIENALISAEAMPDAKTRDAVYAVAVRLADYQAGVFDEEVFRAELAPLARNWWFGPAARTETESSATPLDARLFAFARSGRPEPIASTATSRLSYPGLPAGS